MTVELVRSDQRHLAVTSFSGQKNLFIATCTLGRTRVEWGIRLSSHMWPVGRNRLHVAIIGMDTCTARNAAIAVARDNECEFMLFWDDDVVPRSIYSTINLVDVMIKYPEVDIVGGVYPKRGATSDPLVVKNDGGGVWWGWQDGQIHQVHMTGTGLLLIRMSSLLKLDVPMVEPPPDPDCPLREYFCTRDGCTDDFWFARLCAQQGLKWYVHGGVTADQVDLDGRIWKFEDAEPQAKIVPAEEEKPYGPLHVEIQDEAGVLVEAQ